MNLTTVVPQISAYGHLNITYDFGLHGGLPGICIIINITNCMEIATNVDPMKHACQGHYGAMS